MERCCLLTQLQIRLDQIMKKVSSIVTRFRISLIMYNFSFISSYLQGSNVERWGWCASGVSSKSHQLSTPGGRASLFGKAPKSPECFQTRSIFTKLCKALQCDRTCSRVFPIGRLYLGLSFIFLFKCDNKCGPTYESQADAASIETVEILYTGRELSLSVVQTPF